MSRRIRDRRRGKRARQHRSVKKQIYLEIIYFMIIVLMLSCGGYSLSYFTSQADLPANEFIAGTVRVAAGDTEGNLVITDSGGDTWRPGECRELELTIKNTGSKRAYARARFEAAWKAQYHTNNATVTANYITSDQGTPVQIRRDAAASYSYGDYAGEEGGLLPPEQPPHWFTGFDHTSPLSFISAWIVEQAGGGGGAGGSSMPGLDAPAAGRGSPEVNGLFYGDGDYLLYSPIAVVPSGTTLYAYLDEQPDGARTLYVALVVSRSVNDNVFDNGSGAYCGSAGWEKDRIFKHIANSEYMAFQLRGHNVATGQDEIWTWQQCYGYQQDRNGQPKHWKDENNIDPTWASDHTAKAGSGTPPPGYISSSSLVWNLNNYAKNRDDPAVPKWDVTLGGTRTWEHWKSPFDPAYPFDITRVDGYPSTGPITFSETYGWEWPMVYEFSVDMTAYSPYYLELGNISSHHSPAKSGGENDPFDGDYKIPGLSIIKEVTLDGGSTWHSGSPWPALPETLPEGFAPQYRFTVKNTGDVELTAIEVTDDTLGIIGRLPVLAPGGSHQFVCTDHDWEAHRLELDPGSVIFQPATGMEGWVEGDDGYFYYTEPLGPGESVTLRVKACIAEGLDELYRAALLTINSFVEAVQASHGAVDDLWPGHPPLGAIPTGPSLRLTKRADCSSAVAGDTIDYMIVVTNNGNVTLNDITVEDEMLGISAVIASLAPGAPHHLAGSYVVKQSDSGTLTNTATAGAIHEGDAINAMGSASVVVLPANPSLQLIKQANRSSAIVGDTIYYLITVVNNGSVTLNDILLEDEMLGLSRTIASLAPGAISSIAGNYTIVQDDLPGPLENSALASATYRGVPVSAAAAVSVELNVPVPFSSLQVGDYVVIPNNYYEDHLFQKIGNDWVLLRDSAGTATQPIAVISGQNYAANFPSTIVASSSLLKKSEAQALIDSIRGNGTDWWASDNQNVNRRYYIDQAGVFGESGDGSVHEIRPSMILQPQLMVTGGDGTAANPYVLIEP